MKKIFLLIAYAILFLPFQSKAEEFAPDKEAIFKNWTAEQFVDPRGITAIEVSPDGQKSLLVYDYTSKQHLISSRCAVIENKSKKILFATEEQDGCTAASWSPDGKWVSLVYSDENGAIFKLASTSDYKPRNLFGIPNMEEVKWSPNSQKIAFLAISTNTNPRLKTKDVAVEKGTALSHRNIYIVDINTEEKKIVMPYVITPNDITVGANFDLWRRSYSWAPNSESIAFSFLPTADPMAYDKLGIAIVDVNSGIINYLNTTRAAFGPVFSPDGKRLAYVVTAPPIEGERIKSDELYLGVLNTCVLDLASQTKQCLAETPNKRPKIIGWYEDSSSILVQDYNKTKTALYALPLNGQEALVLPTDEIGSIGLPTLNSSNTYVGFRGESFFKAPEAFVSPLKTFKPVQVTDLHKGFPKPAKIKVETINWTSFDGKIIEGFLFYPVGYKKGQKVPLLTTIHGGPIGLWQEKYLGDSGGAILSIPFLANQGFAVFAPNLRGSDGYGLEFRQSIYQDWGEGPFKDLMTGIDALVAKGIVDPEKLVISGWSYGGYLTAWAIGHTDRFKAAILGAAPINLISERGNSLSNIFITSYYGGYYWDNYKAYLDNSPIMYVENVKTPTLIQQGEYDQTVPLSQAYELYNALKQRGVPTKMTIYKNQGHSFNAPAGLAALKETYFWMDQHGLFKEQ